MLNRLRNNPVAAALIVFSLYVASFFAPLLFIHPDPGQHGISGVEGAIGQWKFQLIMFISLSCIVTLLGWWKKIGFTTPLNRGGIKFLMLPVGYILLLLYAAASDSANTSWLLASTSPLQMLQLILLMLGLGFTEETMFRGILFYGFSARFSILAAVIISSLIFGILHYVNLIVGASLAKTNFQVLHAIAAGFMYIALRLRIGALWPVMIFHALWNFCLSNIEGMKIAVEANQQVSILVNIGMQILPAALYGSFVYWRWTVYRDKDEQDRQLQPAPETL